MKIVFLVFITILVISSYCKKTDELSVSLNTGWKFITGDNAAYSDPSFDDSQWKSIKSDKLWEEYGYKLHDGFAWYRIKVIIPSGLKSSAYLKDSLNLFLGKINDFDQAYLNGEYIGSNCKTAAPGDKPDSNFIKAPGIYWDQDRNYIVAANDSKIKWDKENVIAVRVFDAGGKGGIYSGDQAIKMRKTSDYLNSDITLRQYVIENGIVTKSFSVKNISSSYTVIGRIKIKTVNKVTGAAFYPLNEEVSFAPGEVHEFTFSFPQSDNSEIVTSLFTYGKTGSAVMSHEESPYILTLPAPAEPRINGARVYGARPGRPFMFTVPATGDRPMKFAATNLPGGLSIDSATGIIKGKAINAGDYEVTLVAENSKGKTASEFLIKIGDRIALTPPMGWSTWNCWAMSVDEGKVIAGAKAFREKGLINHGWTYIQVDAGFTKMANEESTRKKNGDLLTNSKFTDMKALGDTIHSLGLKFGVYSSPGPQDCMGATGSYMFELNDARSFAEWGADYLKYDWCSYGGIAKDTSLAEYKKPYIVMREALNKVDRDIVYSLCQYGMGDVWKWGDEVGGNLWRTTQDITDEWKNIYDFPIGMADIGFNQVKNAPYSRPGNWNDPDMLVVGWVGWGPTLRPTRLTPDEQYTHISLWSLLSAPLMMGCEPTRLDPFTLNLLNNDEVLALDQDPLGDQAVPVIIKGDFQVWIKNLADGSKALGIFNLGSTTGEFNLIFKDAGLDKTVIIRDLWRQKDLGSFTGSFKTRVPSHGVILVRVKN